MIQHNPEIETVIASATDLAKKYNHEYVTLEHLTLGLLTFKPWNDLMVAFGVDINGMISDIDDYLSRQTYLVNADFDTVPKKTHSLERVFNRAFTQVLFSGRNHVQIIDIFLSISSETNSRFRTYQARRTWT